VDRVAGLPVLLLITFRPEFESPWTGQSHVTMLALSRLDRRQGATLAQRVAGNKALPGDTMEEIIKRTDGVPLFIEELTKAVVEVHAGQDSTKNARVTTALSRLAVPATLHAS